MCSSSPVRAPKLQLAVEQPSIGGHWNLSKKKKDTLCPETKKKLQWDGQRGVNTIKSNPIPAGWATHSLKSKSNKYKKQTLFASNTLNRMRPQDNWSKLELPPQIRAAGCLSMAPVGPCKTSHILVWTSSDAHTAAAPPLLLHQGNL